MQGDSHYFGAPITIDSEYTGWKWGKANSDITMSIIDAYSEDFNAKCQEISSSISELKECSNADRDKVSSLVRCTDNILTQADQLIKQMELEVRSQDASTKMALTEKMRLYKDTLRSHRSDFIR